jgi:hypothetical protein
MSTLRVDRIIPLTGTTVTISGSINVTTASYANTSTSSSYAVTASFVNATNSATSASYAVTASYAMNGGGGGGDFENIDSDILPSINGVYDLGSSTNKWYDLNIDNSIKLGDSSSISTDADNDVIINSNTVVQGILSANIGSFGDITIEDNRLTYLGAGYSEDIEVDQNLNVLGTLKAANNNVQIDTEYSAGVWTAGGSLSTARSYLAGAGTQNAALSFGGYNVPNDLKTTEEYNGTSWTSGGNLITGRSRLAGVGTQDAALAIGGLSNNSSERLTSTEEYNGTLWSSGGNLNASKNYFAGAGTQNAALAFGGYNAQNAVVPTTEEYNGTSWSLGGNLNSARIALAGAGTQTAALAFGGQAGVYVRFTEEYDGTSWAFVNPMINNPYGLGGAGKQNAALAFGGAANFGGVLTTEEYNGTSWTSGGNLTTIRVNTAGAGTQNAALAFGGNGNDFSNYLSSTEEYNKSSYSAMSLTGSLTLNSINNTLPSGSVGSLAVSGSSLYFHDGTDWKAVSLV